MESVKNRKEKGRGARRLESNFVTEKQCKVGVGEGGNWCGKKESGKQRKEGELGEADSKAPGGKKGKGEEQKKDQTSKSAQDRYWISEIETGTNARGGD